MNKYYKQFREIVNGYKNTVFPNKEVEKLALERALICSTCVSNKANFCSKCGCNLTAKTRSINSNCPKNLW